MSNKNTQNDNFSFHDLMLYRIHEILLVASPYDAFILEQDGKLTEQIMNEYTGMNLSYAPRVWNAPSANDAIKLIEKRTFDLIIIMMRLSDMSSIRLGKKIKNKYPKKPIVLLAFDESEIKKISLKQKKYFNEIFIWSGDSNVFPAIIKCIEDKKNISRDIRKADIRAIIFIEDTPKYYSSILPIIYKEIIYHTKDLIDNSLNTVLLGNNNLSGGGSFSGGEVITVNIDPTSLPISVDYIIYDDEFIDDSWNSLWYSSVNNALLISPIMGANQLDNSNRLVFIDKSEINSSNINPIPITAPIRPAIASPDVANPVPIILAAFFIKINLE